MKNKKVLIVEDEKDILEIYNERFSLEGMQVTEAISGIEGIASLKKQVPDIILLDIRMPEMNGFEFLKEIKKDKKYRDIPVLLLTNLGEQKIDMDKDLAFALGIKGYLIKAKNTPDQVLDKVKEILNIK
ncbi:response regulator [bacterium (Candidatus Howlettbacteria) CG_4_10_14_0_8_um_filter_40_9]|nr:MAG: response regulator [bacterium (Candidatus Howlettbacteria) CG_4_10_14_0_8_um_filter_40_9]